MSRPPIPTIVAYPEWDRVDLMERSYHHSTIGTTSNLYLEGTPSKVSPAYEMVAYLPIGSDVVVSASDDVVGEMKARMEEGLSRKNALTGSLHDLQYMDRTPKNSEGDLSPIRIFVSKGPYPLSPECAYAPPSPDHCFGEVDTTPPPDVFTSHCAVVGILDTHPIPIISASDGVVRALKSQWQKDKDKPPHTPVATKRKAHADALARGYEPFGPCKTRDWETPWCPGMAYAPTRPRMTRIASYLNTLEMMCFTERTPSSTEGREQPIQVFISGEYAWAKSPW